MTDWQVWHEQYSDPESSLSRRLSVVRRMLEDLVADLGPDDRVLSLCAGDGRDILPVLAQRAPGRRPELALVELDPSLAAAAEAQASAAGIPVTVVVGDAGDATTWRDLTPVDLLLLCGIFGNVTDEDIEGTIAAASSMLRPGGAVIWTRGVVDDRDRRPQVRAWFEAADFQEIAYEGEPESFGVGCNRLTTSLAPQPLPDRLFTFVR
jgi:cyclopropane fatty-acyl-phospholipid synthase-like methyltransferase